MTLTGLLAVAAGLVGTAWVLSSIVRTVVIPRPERVWLTVVPFELARRLSRRLAHRAATPTARHLILGSFGPTVLVLLPLLWSVGVATSFSAIYWGLGPMSLPDAVELSGSSLTTLGFTPAPTFATRMVAIVEALIGLAIVALLISFLPSLYATFSHREVAVGRLTVRAGTPPEVTAFLARIHTIGGLHRLPELWREWEDWFVELGETHTSFPALIYFRSASPDRSWLTAAETALDSAAVVSATRLIPSSGEADTMIRAGYLALDSIAEVHGRPPTAVDPDGDITVDRAAFDRLLVRLTELGLPVAVDGDEAWATYRGWRVNYDRSLAQLQDLVFDVASHWDALSPPPDRPPSRGAEPAR